MITKSRAVLFFLPVFAASAARASDKLDKDYAKGYGRHAGTMLASPMDWGWRQWTEAALVGGAIGALSTQDRAVRRQVQKSGGPPLEGFTNAVGRFGSSGYLLPAYGVLLGGGYAAGSSRLRNVALMGLESHVLSALVVEGAKMSSHRHRPWINDSKDTWDGPSWEHRSSRGSFPSGHTTSAAAFATVLSMEYGHTYVVPALAWSFVAFTAASRIYKDRHWASDTAAGIALGHYTARFVVGAHRREGAAKVAVAPVIYSGLPGLAVRTSF